MTLLRFAVFAAAVAVSFPAMAAGPYYAGHYGYAGYDSCRTCEHGYGHGYGYGCGVWGCCERPLSKYDHIWDTYCQEKCCPCLDPAYMRPYWHGGPASACCDTAGPGCATGACAGPGCASPISHVSGHHQSTQPVQAHYPSDMPPPSPPAFESEPAAPSAAPAPSAEPNRESLDLRLQGMRLRRGVR